MTTPLTVAVTGPTGTFGFGLMPLLEADERIGRVIGIARRPFDPAEHGWSKMEYRQGDVRDEEALADAFDGVDVVVHLAFLIASNAPPETIHEINVDGTLNVFRAAAAAGVERFVYASSVAAYGFHADNPIGMTETWPTRPARRMRYAQEKAHIEELLDEASAASPDLDLYLLRPPIVLGPHVVGGKQLLPGPLDEWGARLASAVLPLRLPVPALVPTLPVQFIHEDDVGQAFLLCVVAAGPPGAYNIAGDGVMTGADVARELGVAAIPIPGAVTRTAARLATALPLPKQLQADWIEAAAQPAIMDATKAKEQLGWRPRYSSAEALRDTLRRSTP
jgi:nucleoside-diphosphate-sugar epimerase